MNYACWRGSSLAANPYRRVFCSVVNLKNSMKWYQSLLTGFALDDEVRFSQTLDKGGAYLFCVVRGASVSVSYQVVVRILFAIPSKSVENILEGMNQRLVISRVCDWVSDYQALISAPATGFKNWVF